MSELSAPPMVVITPASGAVTRAAWTNFLSTRKSEDFPDPRTHQDVTVNLEMVDKLTTGPKGE